MLWEGLYGKLCGGTLCANCEPVVKMSSFDKRNASQLESAPAGERQLKVVCGVKKELMNTLTTSGPSYKLTITSGFRNLSLLILLYA